jgi:hypothetical protein
MTEKEIPNFLVRLNLLVELVCHSTIFFSHNKSANNTFCHGFSAKRTVELADLAEQDGVLVD